MDQSRNMKWPKELDTGMESTSLFLLLQDQARPPFSSTRIGRLIIDEEVDVDRFLITTFTNAAASEMKERLKTGSRKNLGNAGKTRIREEGIPAAPDKASAGCAYRDLPQLRHRHDQRLFLPDRSSAGIHHRRRDPDKPDEEGNLDGIFERRFAEDGDRFKAFLRKYSRRETTKG